MVVLFCCICVSDYAQSLSEDPDSVLAEWLEAYEWEGLNLYPDIAMEWLLEMDSLTGGVLPDRHSTTHLFTVNVPVNADLGDCRSDSGDFILPISIKYRLKVSDSRRWEYRLQASQAAGDTCFVLPRTGVPEHATQSLLIRPGEIFREIIIGDFQVSSGFGAVAGSGPVFSVSIGNPGSLCRAGKGIRPYSGSSEGRFLRGVAGNIQIGQSEVVVYGSGKDLTQEGVTGIGYKRSFISSEVGITGIMAGTRFPPAVKEGWTSMWQPDSERYIRIGFWGQVRVPFGILFGEAGWSPNGGYAWIGGIRWFEAHGFSAVLRYSGCTPGYPVTYTLFQSGVAQTNEGQKVIASYRFAPGRQLETLGSIEVNLSQWPGSNTRFMNYSTRVAQQVKFLSKSKWTCLSSLQLDFLESGRSVPQKLTWKMAFDSDPAQSGTLRLRAGIRQQFKGFGTIISKGTTADCSLSLATKGKKLHITCGFRIFSVESSSDPLYTFEPDVRFGFSAPVLTGSGTGCFAVMRWSILKNLDLEVKVGRTAYTDLKHIAADNPGGFSGKVQVNWKLQI